MLEQQLKAGGRWRAGWDRWEFCRAALLRRANGGQKFPQGPRKLYTGSQRTQNGLPRRAGGPQPSPPSHSRPQALFLAPSTLTTLPCGLRGPSWRGFTFPDSPPLLPPYLHASRRPPPPYPATLTQSSQQLNQTKQDGRADGQGWGKSHLSGAD